MHLLPASSLLALVAACTILLPASSPVNAHSWLECSDFRGGKCHGWMRGWDDLHRDQLMTWRLQGPSDPHAPVCEPNRQKRGADNPAFPMARGRPGQTLTITYMERNHAVRDVPKPDAGQYTIHWSPAVNDDTMLQWRDLGAHNQLGNPVNFDDGQCADLGVEQGRVKRPCWGRFTVPQDAMPGRHQVVWSWHYKLGNEYYTSCFDVEVLPPGEQPSDKLPPHEMSRWMDNKDFFNPGYGNNWYDYTTEYAYSDEVRAQVADGSVAAQQRTN